MNIVIKLHACIWAHTRQRWMSLSCSEFVLSPHLLQPVSRLDSMEKSFHSFIGSSSSPVNGSGSFSFLCNMIYSHQKERHWKVVEKREKNEREEKHIFQPAAETKWKLHEVDGALSVLRVLKGERRCDFSFAKKYIEKKTHSSRVSWVKSEIVTGTEKWFRGFSFSCSLFTKVLDSSFFFCCPSSLTSFGSEWKILFNRIVELKEYVSQIETRIQVKRSEKTQ